MYYYNDNSFLSRLERKIGRFAIKNWAYILVIAMAMVWIADFILARFEYPTLSSYMYFNRDLVFQGQVWRVVTFVFMPEDDNVFFVLLTLYFYWFIGTTVENEWGAFRFNVFYLTGYLGALASGFIIGMTTNYYLNLTIFLAYAILNAESVVYIFFVIPIKVKWLAIIEFVLIAIDLIFAGWIARLAILFSLLNVTLFFWKDVFYIIKNYFRRRRYKKQIEQGYYEADVNPPKEKKKKPKKKNKDMQEETEVNTQEDNDGFFD